VLNSASTLITIDFYKKLINPDATDHQEVRFGQIGGAVVLVIGMLIAWYFSTLKQPLFVLVQNVFFYIAPPFAVIFTLGILWRRATAKAALATIFTGFVFTFILDNSWKDIPYLHRAFAAWTFCMVVMTAASYLTAPPPEEKVEGIIWNPKYAQLPAEERRRYSGWRDFRIWWLLFVGIVLSIYGFFIWARFQYPVDLVGGTSASGQRPLPWIVGCGTIALACVLTVAGSIFLDHRARRTAGLEAVPKPE
jgi:SSS family solute:Na+ symporter